MVGSIWRRRFGNWGSKDGLQTAAYTLDNDISYGGSGGPVIDNHGRLVAIISKRGLGSADKFQIPMVNGDYLPKWPTATSNALAQYSYVTDSGRIFRGTYRQGVNSGCVSFPQWTLDSDFSDGLLPWRNTSARLFFPRRFPSTRLVKRQSVGSRVGSM